MSWAFNQVETFAAFLLRKAGIRTYPVPVEELAIALGADRISYERLEGEDGRLELRGSEVVIVVQASSSPARRRFTIAHEIGHLVLGDPRYEVGALRCQAGLQSEERLCDRIAEALLMPAAWIAKRYEGAPQQFATLHDCSDSFGVSAAAANLRLARCTEWSRALLRFGAHRDRWQLAGVTGWAPERRESVCLIDPTSRVLQHFADPDSLSRLWLPLACGGREWLVGAELWGRDGWAFALADPARRQPLRRGARCSTPVPLVDSVGLKLFYLLDDIDACILPQCEDGKEIDEQADERQASRRALAA